MKIATWNVNSLNVRKDHVLEWMESAEPDILALQEYPYKVVSATYGCNHDFFDTQTAILAFNKLKSFWYRCNIFPTLSYIKSLNFLVSKPLVDNRVIVKDKRKIKFF